MYYYIKLTHWVRVMYDIASRWWPDPASIEMDNALSPSRSHAITCSNTYIFINSLGPCDAYMRQWSYYRWFRWWPSCRLVGARPLPEPVLEYIVGQALGDRLPRGFNRNCTSSFMQICFKLSSAGWRLFVLGLSVLIQPLNNYWNENSLCIKILH